MDEIANELRHIADGSSISKVKLLTAADQLSRADAAARPQAVSNLIDESTAFARDAGNAGENALMRSAVDLALAGQCFLRVAALHKMDRMVAGMCKEDTEQMAKPPVAPGAGWMTRISSWWSRRRRRNDVENALNATLLGPTDSLPASTTTSTVPQIQGRLAEKWLGLQSNALSLSPCVLPYMGRDGVLKKEAFSSDYLWWVNLLFKLWWGLVALGIPCSLYGQCWFELQYAPLSSHLAILGLTVLAGMFSHWLLAIEASTVLKLFLGVTTVAFACFYLRCCRMGDH
ncbi:uncharacterized protein LOC100824126 [Brachypodium distachyon]|nr:uncharacterized protein LOC100824126 [Brachypodium distachyon]|eukprot:XP_024313448.1 uncharacterized protein LOC100824126 [Brachypodium distachyon]